MKKEDNFKPLNSVEVGFLTRERLIQLSADGHERKIETFQHGTQRFFKTAVVYARKNWPFDIFIKKILISRNQRTFNQVEYFIEKFPILSKFKTEEDYDLLKDGYYSYQLMKVDDVELTSNDSGMIQLDKV